MVKCAQLGVKKSNSKLLKDLGRMDEDDVCIYIYIYILYIYIFSISSNILKW
jgi:hypothetical protein